MNIKLPTLPARAASADGSGTSQAPANPTANANPTPAQQFWEMALVGVAALLAAAGLAYLSDFARRALVNGPDTLGVFSIAATTLVAGLLSTLVQPLLTKYSGPAPSASVAKALVIAAMILVLGFLLDTKGAQTVASIYESQAAQAFAGAQYTNALGFYQKAVDLDANQYAYHFGLGSASDKLLDSTRAVTEYQAAHDLDPNQAWPLLNLSEIYMRRSSSDNVSALAEINLVTNQNLGANDWATYIFHRDRGWILLQLNYLSFADNELQAALKLRPDVPGANCLMGMLKEAYGDKPGALEWWSKCLKNYEPAHSEEHEYLDPRWHALAQTRTLDASAH